MYIRFGILGAGRIGQVHAKAVSSVPAAKLVAVAETVVEAAKQVEAAYGCDIRTIDQMAEATDIDAVIICTPTDTHADLIERFCRAGKAVFCEKPIHLDVERVKQCLKVVRESSGKLMVGFQRRFDPDFNALKAAIDQGRIGDVEMVSLTSRDPAPPPHDYIKRSGGIFRDMTIHDFDVARWLLPDEIESVQASASVLVDPGIAELDDFDSVNIIMTTGSGRHCAISNSRRASYGYDQRIEIHGSKGSVSVENTRESRIEIADQAGSHRPPLLDFFMTRYTAAYAAEIEAFVTALRDDQPMPTTGTDGLRALVLAEAALRSVRDGRRVRVSEVSDPHETY